MNSTPLRHRRRETDAVVGAVNVVVHRLRDGDDRDTLVVQPQPVRKRVVTPDRDQCVDTEALDHAKRVVREIVRSVANRLAGEELRHAALLDPTGVRARRVQNRSARAVDRAHRRWGQWHHVRRDRLVVIGVRLEQTRPAAADAEHLVAAIGNPGDDRLDARVEPGNVTTSGTDTDPHPSPPLLLSNGCRLVGLAPITLREEQRAASAMRRAPVDGAPAAGAVVRPRRRRC